MQWSENPPQLVQYDLPDHVVRIVEPDTRVRAGETRMNKTPPGRSFWDDRARRYGNIDFKTDDEGLALVCYRGMPVWWNNYFDYFQRRIFVRTALRYLRPRGKRALDEGTGLGRWANVLSGMGAKVTGIDISDETLSIARRLHPNIEFMNMSAEQLAFDDATFDIVSSVTVLQHLSPESLRSAIVEISRTLKTGGHLLLLESTFVRNRASYIFPKSTTAWIDLFHEHGMNVVTVKGMEYFPLVGILAAFARLLSRLTRQGSEEPAEPSGFDKLGGLIRRHAAVRLFLLTLVYASYPLEFLFSFLLPVRFARYNLFLFVKEREATH